MTKKFQEFMVRQNQALVKKQRKVETVRYQLILIDSASERMIVGSSAS